MKLIIALAALLIASCASQTDKQDGPASVYVQVVGPNGVEVNSDLTTTIRDEAYVYYKSLGLTPATSLADADMTVVFKANEVALRDAVKVTVGRAKVGKGKDIWVTVNGEDGNELNNPISDVIKAQTYAEFLGKGFGKASSVEAADLKVAVYTNDQTLRAAVRKVLNKQGNSKAP